MERKLGNSSRYRAIWESRSEISPWCWPGEEPTALLWLCCVPPPPLLPSPQRHHDPRSSILLHTFAAHAGAHTCASVCSWPGGLWVGKLMAGSPSGQRQSRRLLRLCLSNGGGETGLGGVLASWTLGYCFAALPSFPACPWCPRAIRTVTHPRCQCWTRTSLWPVEREQR